MLWLQRKMKKEPEVCRDINTLLIGRPAEAGEDVLSSFWRPLLVSFAQLQQMLDPDCGGGAAGLEAGEWNGAGCALTNQVLGEDLSHTNLFLSFYTWGNKPKRKT